VDPEASEISVVAASRETPEDKQGLSSLYKDGPKPLFSTGQHPFSTPPACSMLKTGESAAARRGSLRPPLWVSTGT